MHPFQTETNASSEPLGANVLSLNNVSFSFGERKIVDKLSVEIHEGEMWGIRGDSGCGKTSLLRLVLGFIENWSGDVRVCGIPLSAHTVHDIRQNVAYVPQDLSFPCDTIEELIRLPFQLKSNKHVEFSMGTVLREWRKLGIEAGIVRRQLSKISGGQRQRIVLVSSVLLGKKLLLLDEPTSALDSDNVMLVADYLGTIVKQNKAVLIVSHDERLLSKCNNVIDLSLRK